MNIDSNDNCKKFGPKISPFVASVMQRIPCLRAPHEVENTSELKHELIKVLSEGSEYHGRESEEQAEQRSQLHKWVLDEIEVLELIRPADLDKLRVLLTVLLITCSSDEKLIGTTVQLKNSKKFIDQLAELLGRTKLRFSSRQGPFEDNNWRERILAAGRTGDYLTLGSSIRHVHLELPPEIRAAVIVLAKLDPEKIAQYITSVGDVFFSIGVKDLLYRQSLELAKVVSDITFKFICASEVADIQVEHISNEIVDNVTEILFQVARSNLWQAFLCDFVKYPKPDTVVVKAMSIVLPKLSTAHWAAFISAVELWTYSPTASPVASMLIPLANDLGTEKSAEIWKLAFERWDKWDYGSSGSENHLSAPTACSFDFPVAMYYALQPIEETAAEEAKLELAISIVERQWFSSSSELVTARNRLLSRLRLLQHSSKIRKSSSEPVEALPPPVQAESEFAAIRYRFFDSQSGRGY
jgi:hypothetical protein